MGSADSTINNSETVMLSRMTQDITNIVRNELQNTYNVSISISTDVNMDQQILITGGSEVTNSQINQNVLYKDLTDLSSVINQGFQQMSQSGTKADATNNILSAIDQAKKEEGTQLKIIAVELDVNNSKNFSSQDTNMKVLNTTINNIKNEFLTQIKKSNKINLVQNIKISEGSKVNGVTIAQFYTSDTATSSNAQVDSSSKTSSGNDTSASNKSATESGITATQEKKGLSSFAIIIIFIVIAIVGIIGLKFYMGSKSGMKGGDRFNFTIDQYEGIDWILILTMLSMIIGIFKCSK